ncbi:MAG TPA: hypothetical protein VMR31_14250 [Myxococcota bacterium]|nr:hypothetical protein [Myxococcota bacterium]
MTVAIWLAAGLVYLAFWSWYVGWRGPLATGEIDAYLKKLAADPGVDSERRDRMRGFLESDDGREFIMVNLIRLQPEPIAPPGGGAPQPPLQVLQGYTGPFMRALFRRGGHPALMGRAAAGYLEAWGVEKNPGWTVVGCIRYRSRRDLAEMASMPAFAHIHPFKHAAIANTLAFPIAPARLFFSPRVVVALALALVAALLGR